MRDRIALRELQVDALIGAFEHERNAPQRLLVDVELRCDLETAAESDRLEDTVDYFALARRLRERAAATSHRLLERLADDFAEICLEDPRVGAVTVTIHKPRAVPESADTSVSLTRDRSARA